MQTDQNERELERLRRENERLKGSALSDRSTDKLRKTPVRFLHVCMKMTSEACIILT